MSPEPLAEITIECGFCHKDYHPSESPDSLCSACPSSKSSCGKSRCPNCSYDNPLPVTGPSWLMRLLGRRKSR